LVGRDKGFEDGLRGLLYNLVAVEGNESDLVAVKYPDESEGERDKDMPARKFEAVQAIEDMAV
jgi:hypothetical protein